MSEYYDYLIEMFGVGVEPRPDEEPEDSDV